MMGIFDGKESITNSDVGFGISQPAYDNTILELEDYVDKISIILRDIEMLVYNSQDYFKGDVGDEIRSKFKEYSKQIDLMKNNLSSYSKDLLKLKQALDDNDKALINKINEYIDSWKSKLTQVNEK